MGNTSRLGPSPILLTSSGDITDLAPLHRELQTLHERSARLDELLREAVMRQRLSGEPQLSEGAQDEERRYLAELDRLMTRIRAVEGQILLRRPHLH